jgi:acetylornithine deacetylase/succinyl-diaminopimelate desuccinylase-like protein
MSRIVLALETEYAAELAARPAHPRLGRPTINVGRIDGGRQPNIVPAECTIDIDRRTLPGETEAGVRREIHALLRRQKLKASFDTLRTSPCEPLDTNPDLPLVQSLTRAAGRRTTRGVHYFTDVLGGYAIGAGVACGVHLLSNELFKLAEPILPSDGSIAVGLGGTPTNPVFTLSMSF